MYQDYESHGQGSFLTGLLWGAAVGAALGVIMAPRAGADTRQQLARTGGRLREKVSETYSKASEGVSSAMERGREAFERSRPSGESIGSTGAGSYGAGSASTSFGSGTTSTTPNPLNPDYPSSRGI